MSFKKFIIDFLRSTALGNRLYFFVSRQRNGAPKIDMSFPNIINIEISSVCNLKCIHCPSHNDNFKDQWRKFGFMTYDIFEKIMNEIDNEGVRKISLHKDGEPLLNPNIHEILSRVKRNVNHYVYLTTNGHKLTKEVSMAILQNKIDELNISIGAYSSKWYKSIRGGNIEPVINNVNRFLELLQLSEFKTKVIVQIINLKDQDLKSEIKDFKNYWSKKNVEIQVWDELTWGVKGEDFNYRYPCLSIWDTFSINSDGFVSACCMDWNQSLITGNIQQQSIREIWSGDSIKKMRLSHIKNDLHDMKLCEKCNYWHWQPMLTEYLN